jgi:predicted nucleotidyltransferase
MFAKLFRENTRVSVTMGEITVRRVVLGVPYLRLATSRPACWRTAAQTAWKAAWKSRPPVSGPAPTPPTTRSWKNKIIVEIPNHSRRRTRIPRVAIQSVVDQIAAGFHPQRIILFGSYAYGVPKPESDVDLLVVMETELTETGQAIQIYRQLQYRFGLDLILYTRQRLAWGGAFLKEITTRGKVVHESSDP